MGSGTVVVVVVVVLFFCACAWLGGRVGFTARVVDVATVVALGTGVGRKRPTTEAGGALVWSDTGTADIKLTITASAATNAGTTRLTVLYAQNNNLNA